MEIASSFQGWSLSFQMGLVGQIVLKSAQADT